MYDRNAWLYDVIYAGKDYVAEANRLHHIIQRRNPGARSLLDVACGSGKHLEQLRDRYEVEGADLSAELLQIAAKRLPGVPLHRADMRTLNLGRRFDAVTCLFSAIGAAQSMDELHAAVSAMAGHLEPRGVLVLEPWIPRDEYLPGGLYSVTRDEPDLKVTRMNISEREGDLAVLDFHWLVGTPGGIEYFTERHELGLFSDAEYKEAFEAAGLAVDHDAQGLIGRGLYIGTRSADGQATSAIR